MNPHKPVYETIRAKLNTETEPRAPLRRIEWLSVVTELARAADVRDEAHADGTLVIYASMPDGDGEPIHIEPPRRQSGLGGVRRCARRKAKHAMSRLLTSLL